MSDDIFKQRVVETLDHLARAVTMLTYNEKREASDALDQARMVLGSLRESVAGLADEETRAS